MISCLNHHSIRKQQPSRFLCLQLNLYHMKACTWKIHLIWLSKEVSFTSTIKMVVGVDSRWDYWGLFLMLLIQLDICLKNHSVCLAQDRVVSKEMQIPMPTKGVHNMQLRKQQLLMVLLTSMPKHRDIFLIQLRWVTLHQQTSTWLFHFGPMRGIQHGQVLLKRMQQVSTLDQQKHAQMLPNESPRCLQHRHCNNVLTDVFSKLIAKKLLGRKQMVAAGDLRQDVCYQQMLIGE